MKLKTFYTSHRETCCLVIFAVLFVLFCAVFTHLLTPVRESYGASWQPFLRLDDDSVDVMVFGSSIAYCDVDPSVVAAKTGLSAYIMAGPEQTMPVTYSYVMEAFETQSPSVIFVEATGAFFERYMNYTRANIGQMPAGYARLLATVNAAEAEVLPGLIFPLYDYHGRLLTMTAAELKLAFTGAAADENRGFMPMEGTNAEINPSQREITASDEIVADSLEYLRMIGDFCGSRGARVVYFIAPTFYTLPDDAKLMLEAALRGHEFYDFSSAASMAELDFDVPDDFFDSLHLNKKGAAIFTAALCKETLG